jgi:hypothetical protein
MRAGPVGLRHLSVMLAPVGLGIADHMPLPVDRAIGGLHRHLGPTIAVEILHQKLGIMRPRADIGAEVDPPQPLARQRIAVEIDRSGIAALAVVMAVGGVPFQHQIGLPSPSRSPNPIIGGIDIGLAIRGDAARRWVERNGRIVFRPDRHGRLAAPAAPGAIIRTA